MPRTESLQIAIVGATGVVGREIELLDERAFPCAAPRLLASSRSAGSTVEWRGAALEVGELSGEGLRGIDMAFFCAGGEVSRRCVPAAIDHGAIVIDNSSAYRMQADVPLVVPEVNGDLLDRPEVPALIANPNCSTIIALVAVTPLHRSAGVERMVVSTYQSASGGGRELMQELEQQARDHAEGRPLTTRRCGRQYLFNLFSHDSEVGADGYNEEERKLIRETAKIWADETPAVTATCIRVPVLRAHSESITLTLREPLAPETARRILDEAPGVRVIDDPAANRFPEPIDASGGDEVLVGRIRADASQPDGRGLHLFVAGDQLRKGAALNAIQIAERIVRRGATRRSIAVSS